MGGAGGRGERVGGAGEGPGGKMDGVNLSPEQQELLEGLTHYIWWQPGEESLRWPERLIAQVMDIGDWDDECALEDAFAAAVLRRILEHSEAGWFRPKSWSFWNYRLGVVPLEAEAPPMPTRCFRA